VHRPLISEQHWHAGEPLHVVLRSQLAPDQLHPALSSVRVASLKLRNSFSELTPAATSAVIAALASSASTLTALHRLPLWDEEDDEDEVDDDVLPVRSREPALAALHPTTRPDPARDNDHAVRSASQQPADQLAAAEARRRTGLPGRPAIVRRI